MKSPENEVLAASHVQVGVLGLVPDLVVALDHQDSGLVGARGMTPCQALAGDLPRNEGGADASTSLNFDYLYRI